VVERKGGNSQRISRILIKTKKIMLRFYKELWFEKQNVVDYIMATVVTLMTSMVVIGIVGIMLQLIINPTSFDNTTFGIFDTLG
jgi:hypothetical protein